MAQPVTKPGTSGITTAPPAASDVAPSAGGPTASTAFAHTAADTNTIGGQFDPNMWNTNLDNIFGDKNSADAQHQAAALSLSNIYGSGFATVPIEERNTKWSGLYQGANGPTRLPTRQTILAGQLYNEVTALQMNKPDEYRQIQEAMYLGGFYGKQKLNAIDWGAVNDQSYSAFTNLFQLTAQKNAALKAQGKSTMTWQEVMQKQMEQVAPMMQAFGAASGAQGPRVTLADPNALANALDSVSQSTIGRKATADEQRMFVAGYHSLQSNDQGMVGGGTTTAPEVQGEATAQIDQQNHTEKVGYDMLSTFGQFMKLMGA